VSDLRVVRARPEDAAGLTRITVASKAPWGYAAAWMEKWAGILTLSPECIRGCRGQRPATFEG
jgi:hypothetical protein